MTRYQKPVLGAWPLCASPQAWRRDSEARASRCLPGAGALSFGGLKDGLYVDINELPLHSSFQGIGVL